MAPFPPQTTDPLDRLMQVSQSLWTLAHVAAEVHDDTYMLEESLGGMARLLAETLDRVWSDLRTERYRCRCG
jgi:hypothetical protein